jgi:hypothetical protein
MADRRFPSRAPNRAQIVQRFVQQTIRDVKASLDFRRNAAAYGQGWQDACDALLEAFADPAALEDTLLEPNPANVSWGDKREKSE